MTTMYLLLLIIKYKLVGGAVLLTVFDIETYPNYFCFVAKDYDEKENLIKTWKVESDENGVVSKQNFAIIEKCLGDRDKTENLTKRYLGGENVYLSNYIISFNGKRFDLPVLAKAKRDIDRLGATSAKFIYSDAMDIISYDENNNSKAKNVCKVRDWSVRHYDLLICCFLNKSLKQWEMYTNQRIEELPYEPGTNLTSEQKKVVLDYCEFDVTQTAKLFNELGYGERYYGTGNQSSTFTSYLELANLLPPHLRGSFDRAPGSLASSIVYETTTPIPPKTLNPLELFKIHDFDVPMEVKFIIAGLAKGYISKDPKKEDPAAFYKGIKFGKGGAHYIKPGRQEDVFEVDAGSQYPTIIINWGLLKTPEALAKYTKMRDDRLSTKHDKQFTRINSARKRVLNALSGTFRQKSSYNVAYDPAAGEALCYIGQLMMTEIALSVNFEDLIEINTDSVFVKNTPDAVERIRRKCKEIEQRFSISFEEETKDVLYFKDINNYVMYDKEHKPIYGKGADFADFKRKGSNRAVNMIMFKSVLMTKDEFFNWKINWTDYEWTEYVFKYHKSSASKYATIGGKDMEKKNYYFLWTTRDCPNSAPISFTKDLVEKTNGRIKARWGVYGFDFKDMEKYKSYLDYSQYLMDLENLLELWGRPELCRDLKPSKVKPKCMSDIFGGYV